MANLLFLNNNKKTIPLYKENILSSAQKSFYPMYMVSILLWKGGGKGKKSHVVLMKWERKIYMWCPSATTNCIGGCSTYRAWIAPESHHHSLFMFNAIRRDEQSVKVTECRTHAEKTGHKGELKTAFPSLYTICVSWEISFSLLCFIFYLQVLWQCWSGEWMKLSAPIVTVNNWWTNWI